MINKQPWLQEGEYTECTCSHIGETGCSCVENRPRAGLSSTRNTTTTRTTNSKGVGRGHSGYSPGNFSGAWAIHWPGQLFPTFEP